MKLLKGWKSKILTGLAMASMGGTLQAQKPGSIDPSMLGRGPITPASYVIPGPPPQELQYSDTAGPGMQFAPTMGSPSCGVEQCAPSCGPGCSGLCGGLGCGLGHGGLGYGGMGYGGLGHGGMYGGDGAYGCGPDGCGPGCGHGYGLLGGGMGDCNGHCGILGGCGRCGILGCTDLFGRDRCGLLGGIGGILGSCRGKLRPYGEGGIATQRWFDLYGEAMFLQRTKGAANFNTSSLGANSGNFVLGTQNVDFNDLRAGLSLQANVQTGPGSNLEVAYFGLNNWENSARVEITTPSLFSFISAFGTVPNNGFDDSDRSFVHQLDYSSELNNGEINFRRRWSEPYGFFQGSFLCGVRYLDLDEQARFRARGEFDDTQQFDSLRYFDYTVSTQNSLVGFQVGADLWYNLIPGVKIGTEGKTGAYNNRAHQNTSIYGNSLGVNTPPILEEVLANRCAYITQFNTQLVYRLNYSWSFRTSYQLLYVDGVALAAENFNSTPPSLFLPNSGRVPTINNDAEILYQGFSVGAEYMW